MLSIRQVAAQARISHVAAADALDGLVQLGVVAVTVTGRSRVHWLERRSLIARDLVLPAFAAEDASFDRLAAELRAVIPPQVRSAVLFGSYARGDQTPESDIDLLIVADDERSLQQSLRAFDDRAAELHAGFGASVSVSGYTMDRARSLLAEGDNLMTGVVRDGVSVAGTPPAEWGSIDEGAED
ncbi:MAG: nucleotidyltransferase domain-containing protein [Coriobacteriia bacterium]|nr:nucleotidyltransferase domain-containing protein [Coriobacteriia bacterium]